MPKQQYFGCRSQWIKLFAAKVDANKLQMILAANKRKKYEAARVCY